jgi:hypothetical protein
MWRELQLDAVDFAEERVLENPRTVENLARCLAALWGGQFCPQPAVSRLWPPKRRLRPRLAAHTAGFSSLFVGRRPILTGQEDCPT